MQATTRKASSPRVRLYRKLRKLYPLQSARWSHREARALYVADRLERAGLLRWREVEDPDADTSWLDQDCMNDTRDNRAITKRTRETIARDGMVGLVCEFRYPWAESYDPDSGDGLTDWEVGDSLWGMVAGDTDHCRADLAANTVDEFKRAYRDHLSRARCNRPHVA